MRSATAREWEPFWPRGLGYSLLSRPGFQSGRPGLVLCACACERLRKTALECGRGRRGGVAFALGNGGGLLCVVLGGWAALWPTTGRGRASGPTADRGQERRMEGASCSSRVSFRRLFSLQPSFRRVVAGPAPRPGRPRFRSGKFCDAENSGRRGEGEGVMGRRVCRGARL